MQLMTGPRKLGAALHARLRMKGFLFEPLPGRRRKGMNKKVVAAIGVLELTIISAPAWAHLQMTCTPEAARAKGGKIETKLVFTHPDGTGHTMKMETPEAFFTVHKGEKTDLVDLDV
jgi:hypothetical protein